MSDAPARAKERAMDRPIPRDVPVIRTDFPDKLAREGDMKGHDSRWIVRVGYRFWVPRQGERRNIED